MSLTDKAKALNHWSAGIALLGIIFSFAPAATEIGAGISAVGVVFFASRRRRHPAWGLLSVLPILGVLSALVLLTILPPLLEADKPVPARWFLSPALWAAVFFLFSMIAWVNFNPSAVTYRSKIYKRNVMGRSDSGREVRNADVSVSEREKRNPFHNPLQKERRE